MPSHQKHLQQLLDILQSKRLLRNITMRTNYNDEPQIHMYSLFLKSCVQFSDGVPHAVSSGGLSAETKEIAFLKCLHEASERFSMVCYREKDIVFNSFEKLKGHAIDPLLFTQKKESRKKAIGWVKGNTVESQEPYYIPAQTIYYNYKYRKNEPFITNKITTGGAAGFDHESTLLRGMYEIIERDAFMTRYLNKIPGTKINLELIKNKKIKHIYEQFKRYNLEVHLFDFTHDLQIPVFLSVLVDKTGIGPQLTFGLKSGLDIQETICGSLLESFQSRPWLRQVLIVEQPKEQPRKYSEVIDIKTRALFWNMGNDPTHLRFLLDQTPQPLKIPTYNKTAKEQLQYVLHILKKANKSVFYKNITHPYFKETKLRVYKVVIPELQPLYLNERTKELRVERLRTIAKLYHKSFSLSRLNQVPQPFL